MGVQSSWIPILLGVEIKLLLVSTKVNALKLRGKASSRSRRGSCRVNARKANSRRKRVGERERGFGCSPGCRNPSPAPVARLRIGALLCPPREMEISAGAWSGDETGVFLLLFFFLGTRREFFFSFLFFYLRIRDSDERFPFYILKKKSVYCNGWMLF